MQRVQDGNLGKRTEGNRKGVQMEVNHVKCATFLERLCDITGFVILVLSDKASLHGLYDVPLAERLDPCFREGIARRKDRNFMTACNEFLRK